MKKNNKLWFNQLRLKLLYKTIKVQEDKNDKIILSIFLYKLKTFHDIKILECLFLLEYITNIKSHVKSYNKSYQRLDIHIQTLLRRHKYIAFYTYLIKLFYAPMLKRSGNIINVSYDEYNNISFGLENLNYIPMLPEAFIQYNITLYTQMYLKSASKLESLLLLNYFTGL